MVRKPKQIFLQRRHTDDQLSHEKMLNIMNTQRNANQYYKVSPQIYKTAVRMAFVSPVRMAFVDFCRLVHLKSLQIINAGECVEKQKPSYTVGRNVNWGYTMEKSMEVS